MDKDLLRTQKERLNLWYDATSDGLWSWNVTTGELKGKDMSSVLFRLFCFLLCFISTAPLRADEVTILDSRHYSNVLGEARNYRIFLPPGYYENNQVWYPVIYFFHGWSQRYFGIITKDPYDKGDDNGGDNIANFVSSNDVIVVKWDGFNKRKGDDYYLRPTISVRSRPTGSFPCTSPNSYGISTLISGPSRTGSTVRYPDCRWGDL